jgi:hypothetical protein
MRIVKVTGGYAGTVSGRIADEFGADLTGSTLKVKLVLTSAPPPVAADVDWLTPQIDSAGVGEVRFHFTVNDTTAVNTYRLYGKLTVGGVTELVAADDYVRVT